jgi:DNA-binding transcriptional MocR family regulator
VTLPEDGYFDDLYRTALSRGVAFTPSDVFKVGAETRHHMRLCFGAAKESDIRQAVRTLGEIVKERMGSPATGLKESLETQPIV